MVVVPFSFCACSSVSLCVSERESVSMSAPLRKRLDSREIRRERASGMMMMVSRRETHSFAFAHEKTRDPRSPKRGRRRKKRETVFLTDILCVRV